MKADKEPSQLSPNETLKRFLKLKTDHSPKLDLLVNEVHTFCQAARNRNPTTMILAGETGVSKTHTLKRIMALFRSWGMSIWMRGWRHCPNIQFIDWSSIATQDSKDHDFLFEDACECDILLLDDLGSEIDKFKSNEPIERLRFLLGRREKKITAITTNIPPHLWSAKWDDRVNDRLLRGNSTVVDLFGVPSYTEIE